MSESANGTRSRSLSSQYCAPCSTRLGVRLQQVTDLFPCSGGLGRRRTNSRSSVRSAMSVIKESANDETEDDTSEDNLSASDGEGERATIALGRRRAGRAVFIVF